jgi:prefoldin subunit 5
LSEEREQRLLRAVQLLAEEVEAHERRIEALEQEKRHRDAALEAIWRALAAYTEAR